MRIPALLILFLSLIQGNCSIAQASSMIFDTIPEGHRHRIELTVSSDFSAVDSMRVELFGTAEDVDTTLLYTGEYNWIEIDPIDFHAFIMNELQTELILGLGYFDPRVFIPRVYLYRSGVEELIEN